MRFRTEIAVFVGREQPLVNQDNDDVVVMWGVAVSYFLENFLAQFWLYLELHSIGHFVRHFLRKCRSLPP